MLSLCVYICIYKTHCNSWTVYNTGKKYHFIKFPVVKQCFGIRDKETFQCSFIQTQIYFNDIRRDATLSESRNYHILGFIRDKNSDTSHRILCITWTHTRRNKENNKLLLYSGSEIDSFFRVNIQNTQKIIKTKRRKATSIHASCMAAATVWLQFKLWILNFTRCKDW